MNNINISVSNDQSFSQSISNAHPVIVGLLTEWSYSAPLKLRILSELIRSIAIYGINSHPSQSRLARRSGSTRRWVNKVTTELVSMGLLIKQRVIVDGKELACEYSLTKILLDSKIMWALKELIPSFKLLAIFTKKRALDKPAEQKLSSPEFSPYNKLYFKKNFKIIITRLKSTKFTSQSKKISKRYDKPLPFESGVGKTSTNSLADCLQAFKANLFSPQTSRKTMKDDQQELYSSHKKPLRQDTVLVPAPSLAPKVLDAESVVRTAMKETNLLKRIKFLQDMLYNVPRASQPYIQVQIRKNKARLNDQF